MSNCMGAILLVSVSSSSALGPQRPKASIAIGRKMCPRDSAVSLLTQYILLLLYTIIIGYCNILLIMVDFSMQKDLFQYL